MKRSSMHAARIKSPSVVGALLCLLCFQIGALPTRASGAQWAFLVGIERYAQIPHLQYTVADVRAIKETLQERGYFSEDQIVTMTDTGNNGRLRPTRQNMMDTLSPWLERIGSGDHVLVYFSGHGYKDGDGKLYLAPIDCKPDDPSTGIELRWLRSRIEACQAKCKVLIIDACHAAADKGLRYQRTTDNGQLDLAIAKALQQELTNVSDMALLASCSADQKSLIWFDMKHSLFSYWLNLGLKGHADNNFNRVVNIDELFAYVYENVKETSEPFCGQIQEPARHIPPGLKGVPAIVNLKRYNDLQSTLAEMAARLARLIENKQREDVTATRVGVAVFGSPCVAIELAGKYPELAEKLKMEPRLLGKFCASYLAEKLRAESKGRLEVVDCEAFNKALKNAGLSSRSELHTEAIKGLSVEGKKLSHVVTGEFTLRTDRMLTLKTALKSTESREEIAAAGGTAELTDGDFNLIGNYRPPPPPPPAPRDSVGSSEPSLPDMPYLGPPPRRSPPDPLRDSDFRVWIKVGDQVRTPVLRENSSGKEEMYVSLQKGEVYQVEIEKITDQPVMMRLLVDGLNTLPEKVWRNKNVRVEPTALEGRDYEYRPAQRVYLDDAQAWLLREAERNQVYAIRGFYNRVRERTVNRDHGGPQKVEESTFGEFTVVDAPEASREDFTQQMGIITVAFYWADEIEDQAESETYRGAPDLRTEYGQERTEEIKTYDDYKLGDHIVTCHIHYGR